MNIFSFDCTRAALVAVALPSLLVASTLGKTNDGPAVVELTPTVLVFATSSGNVVASVGPDGALLVGTPSVTSTPSIDRVISQRTESRRRYVVIFPELLGRSQGDAGWTSRGAFVAMQENEVRRLGGDKMGAPGPLPSAFSAIGVRRPLISFSEVIAFDLNGEAIHVVHQAPGFSDADAVAHFHVANVVYLGEAFPGDGYPRIDAAQGGTLKGLIDELNPWTGNDVRVVPARGRVTDGATVKAFRAMIVTVTDRVRNMIREGKTEPAILAVHPTRDFDARWGHGRTPAKEFVGEVYRALVSR